MKSLFLFQRTPVPGETTTKKILFWVWNFGLLFLAALMVGMLSLWFSVGDFWIPMFKSYFSIPILAFLNLLPPVMLACFLWFVTGRSWIAFLITACLVMGFTWGNYFKLMFRDDPLLFGDLLLLKEAGDMAGKYEISVHGAMWVAILLILAATALLFFCGRGKPRGMFRLIGAAVLLISVLPISRLYISDSIYNDKTENISLISQWSATQVYISKGFLYPFLHSITDAFPTPPEGYDADEAAAVLAEYQDADISEDQKVNIIGIMLEAYNDFSKYDQIEFNTDVYGAFHELEAESYTGNLITNIFAGGTVYTERCFLTGYSELGDFRSNTNSYVWYLKNQGYQTTGDHPCYQWFYNRLNVNQYLGFDSYRFVENYYTDLTGGGVAYDEVFFPELQTRCLSLMEDDAPLFSFSVSYQGHGPYDTSVCWWGEKGDYVVNQGYSDEEQYILDNYFGSIYDTNQHLAEFVDALRDSDEPVILVVFGDHNPWMGDANSVYEALGINLDCSSEEGFYNYYGVRYLIWANDAAKKAIGFDFEGEGPDIGPYFLMSQLFELCGWDGPAYMQAIDEVKNTVPVHSITGLYVEDGTLTGQLSETGQTLADQYQALQYYSQYHFAY